MYEHRIFTQGALWNIFSFDHWGVRIGKALVDKILPEPTAQGNVTTHDSSADGLMNQYKGWK